MKRIFNVGFCGAGTIVRDCHLPSLLSRPDQFSIAGFFDIKRENAEKLTRGKYKIFDTYESLLTDETIDIVLIATKPLSTHFPLALKALKAHKNVVLEKPMASNASECDELIETAQQERVMLTIHHNRRLDLDFLSLRNIISKGKLGDIKLIDNNIQTESYNSGDIIDWSIHLIDQCLLLNRSPLIEVSANLCSPENGLANCGWGIATLRFEKDPVIRFSMLPRTTEFLLNGTSAFERFHAVGTKASFSQRVIEDSRDIMNATMNFDATTPDYEVPDYLDIKFKGYYDFLYETLAENKPLLVKAEEARNAIRCLELIELSAKENRTVKASEMLHL